MDENAIHPAKSRLSATRRKINGFIGIFLGVCLLGWVGYNYTVEMLPQAQGKNPIPALAMGLFSLISGIFYLKKR